MIGTIDYADDKVIINDGEETLQIKTVTNWITCFEGALWSIQHATNINKHCDHDDIFIVTIY